VDKKGNIWFGSRVAEKDNIDPENRKGKGGVTIFNGKTFSHFPNINGLNNADVFEIYKDNLNNLWISTNSYGVYKYDGSEFKNYNVPISVMSITKDKKGNLWLGGAGGLYKIDRKGNINNVTTNGPWG
jgi:ligand-binding sensor domain-containing protein